MNKVCVAFLTKDRCELTRQSIEPLQQPGSFDLMWVDGSNTTAGIELVTKYWCMYPFTGIRGGAGAAIVFALTKMLEHGYEYCALVENDVLLDPDWFECTFRLFDRGRADGLEVGAVSARCYVDRLLFQRDGFGVVHNLGAGVVLFTAAAARLALNHFRSGWTTDNRRIFCQLSGVDIGPTWAFRGGDHALVADWSWDAMLAAHGYASLALTPSPVQMIGQVPPLAEQGLTIVKEEKKFNTIDLAEDSIKYLRYRDNLRRVREGKLRINVETKFQYDAATHAWTYLPHQLHMIGGRFFGDWKFKEMRAFGEFGWVSGNTEEVYAGHGNVAEIDPSFSVPVYGNAMLLVSGGKNGGIIHVKDESSGYEVEPFVAPEGDSNQCLQLPLPAQVSMRTIRVTCKAPGLCFYRLVTSERQPDDPILGFDHSYLPEPA